MKYRCIDNQDVEELLTLNKEYKGIPHRSMKVIEVHRCDDKYQGYFKRNRFVEVQDDSVSSEPKVSIYQYSLDIEHS